MMHRPVLVFFILAAALTCLSGCQAPKNAKSEEAAATRRDMPDPSGDVSFQAFLGQLRLAVAQRDARVLASLMTPNFGYSLSPTLEGPGVFAYWDEKGLWEELKLVVSDTWVPNGDFMVAPAQFANTTRYSGYRAGITRLGGSWKFAYFVNG